MPPKPPAKKNSGMAIPYGAYDSFPTRKTKRPKPSPDAKAGASVAGMKKLGSYYSGKGAGSADTQAARGTARRSATYKMAGAEGPKKSPAKKASSRSATRMR